MRISFKVAALSGDQVLQAYPVIQASWPDVDLASWRSFVEFFAEGAETRLSEVLGVYDSAGYICGVLAYRRDHDLRRGPMLTVHLFTALDLTNSPRTVAAVIDVAESRAREFGCEGVQIILRKDQARLAAQVKGLGLASEAGLFLKSVDMVATRH